MADSWHPLLELTLARIREILRQPETMFWIFVFPVLLALALGIAFRAAPPEAVRVAVEDTVPQAQDLATALSRFADVHAEVVTVPAAAAALRAGKVALILQPSPQQTVTYRFDPVRPESRLARVVVDDALQRAAGRSDVLTVQERIVTEVGTRYIDFLIPGLIGLNLMSSGIWGLGFALAQARAHKLLKLLAVTPMRRWHFLLSYLLSRFLFLLLEVLVILGFAAVVFDVEVHGSLLSVMLIALLGAFTFAGLGILVAARAQSTEVVTGWMNLLMLPMWLLSGTFFSAARFPDFIQPFVKVLPLTIVNDALRAVVNDGIPLVATGPALGALLLWCVGSFLVALKLFKW